MDKMKWKLEFYDRFCRHEAELTRLYRELYHNDMASFDRFTDMLYAAYAARSEDLKLMDRAREADPDWYKGHDLVGMLMYVNAFAGTLNGVREKLPPLQGKSQGRKQCPLPTDKSAVASRATGEGYPCLSPAHTKSSAISDNTMSKACPMYNLTTKASTYNANRVQAHAPSSMERSLLLPAWQDNLW